MLFKTIAENLFRIRARFIIFLGNSYMRNLFFRSLANFRSHQTRTKSEFKLIYHLGKNPIINFSTCLVAVFDEAAVKRESVARRWCTLSLSLSFRYFQGVRLEWGDVRRSRTGRTEEHAC